MPKTSVLIKTPSAALTFILSGRRWNAIHTNVDENLILRIAHVMKDSGLAAAGFRYVNIDDGWEVDRDEQGRLTADPVRFPSGLKATSDAVHALGLKFGVTTPSNLF